MATVASGLELKDIAQEFQDIFQDMQDVMIQFSIINMSSKGDGSKETFYDGDAQEELAASMDALMMHFSTLTEYYSYCQQYTLNAFSSMMELDALLAEQIGKLKLPRDVVIAMDPVESRDDYLAKQAERKKVHANGAAYE